MFRPLNSSESNVYTIRVSLGNMSNAALPFSGSSIVHTIAAWDGIFHTSAAITATSPNIPASTATVFTNYLVAPSNNNLPSGFFINANVTSSTVVNYTMVYGKTFTTQPNISIIPTGATSVGNVIPIINLKDSGFTTCTFNFYQSAANTSPVFSSPNYTAYAGFDIVITGSVKTGVNTGNSNKGWAFNDSSTADPTGTYTSMDVSLGGVSSVTNSISICKNLKLLNSNNTLVPYATTGSTALVTADYLSTTWLINCAAGAVTLTGLTPQIGMVLIIQNISTPSVTTATYIATISASSPIILFPGVLTSGSPPTLTTASTLKTNIFLASGAYVMLFGTSASTFSVIGSSPTGVIYS